MFSIVPCYLAVFSIVPCYNSNWDALINSSDINVYFQNWEQQFMYINEIIPKGTLPKRQNLPWLSKIYSKLRQNVTTCTGEQKNRCA